MFSLGHDSCFQSINILIICEWFLKLLFYMNKVIYVNRFLWIILLFVGDDDSTNRTESEKSVNSNKVDSPGSLAFLLPICLDNVGSNFYFVSLASFCCTCSTLIIKLLFLKSFYSRNLRRKRGEDEDSGMSWIGEGQEGREIFWTLLATTLAINPTLKVH